MERGRAASRGHPALYERARIARRSSSTGEKRPASGPHGQRAEQRADYPDLTSGLAKPIKLPPVVRLAGKVRRGSPTAACSCDGEATAKGSAHSLCWVGRSHGRATAGRARRRAAWSGLGGERRPSGVHHGTCHPHEPLDPPRACIIGEPGVGRLLFRDHQRAWHTALEPSTSRIGQQGQPRIAQPSDQSRLGQPRDACWQANTRSEGSCSDNFGTPGSGPCSRPKAARGGMLTAPGSQWQTWLCAGPRLPSERICSRTIVFTCRRG